MDVSDDTAALAQTIRDAMDYLPDAHHHLCNTRKGGACDCYGRRSNAAHVALDALVERLETAELENSLAMESLREFNHVEGEPLFEVAAVAASAYGFLKHRAETTERERAETTECPRCGWVEFEKDMTLSGCRTCQLEAAENRREDAEARVEALQDALRRITDAYTAETEDHNDGEFALWKADDLIMAIVDGRAALGGTPGGPETTP